ncbi:MAG: right-handed parallel beta-helix repeat-containing protein [Candidatus Sumerlaeota bacterium]
MKFSAVVATVVLLAVGGAASAVTLQSVFDGTVGNTMTLSAGTTYTGGCTINRNMTINGNGATLAMNRSAVERIDVNNGITLTINNLRVTSGFSVAHFGTGSTGTLNGVIANNLETAVEHEGNGSLTVTSSVFSDITSRGIITFGAKNSTAMTLNLKNTEFRNAAYGVQLEGGAKLTATNCSFINVTNAIWTTGGQLGTAAARAKLTSCTFNGGEFGVVLLAGTFTDVNGCTMLGYRYPFQIKFGADVNLSNALILQNGVSNPSVAISVTDGASLRASNCQVTGYVNSFDTSINGFMDIDNCTATHPAFSGIICKDGSVANVRNSTFINNGQDSIFYGTDFAGSGDTARGTIENNLSINAGIDNQFGTGIALLSSGPFTMRNNMVINSLDVGVAIKYGANATLEGNQFVANRKAGIYVSGAGNVTLRDNTSAAQTVNGQAGIIIDGSNGAIVMQRNMFAGNSVGILWRGTASSTNAEYNFATRSLKQGALVTQGVLSSPRSAYVDNVGYQAFVSSSSQSSFIDSLFTATSVRLGVYTERGACGGSVSNRTLATGGWWNSSSGPVNRCSGSSSDARMEYQNADTGGFRSSPQLEVLFAGVLNNAFVTSRVPSAGGTLLPTVSLPGGLGNNAFVGVFRPSAAFSEAAPGQSAGQPPVYLWSSPALQSSGGNVTLQFPEGTGLLAHLDRTTGGFDDLITAQPGGSTLTFVVPASRLENGTWYFVNDSGYGAAIDLLLGKRSAVGVLPGLDLRIDAADL